MDITATVAEIRSLSVDERLAIVEAIWDSILADADELDVTPDERKLIEQRLTAYLANPNDVVAWDDVKGRAMQRSRR